MNNITGNIKHLIPNKEITIKILTIKPLYIFHQLVELQCSGGLFDAVSLLYSVE